MNSRSKRLTKPTVFLSHSSNNRRELLALKRLLDERAGGMIDFFLSSDEDSISHGTIWPAEVRAALDRMTLMLVFVSAEALKSGWTYFEAGYGLHKLGAANIYCLPGTSKASLPSPFNILQNRNLHTARDMGLLIRQLNEVLGGRMSDEVARDEFERIFRKPMLGEIDVGPRFSELVSSVVVTTMGAGNGMSIFRDVCEKLGFPVSSVELSDNSHNDELGSTGVRISIKRPDLLKLLRHFEISEDARRRGVVEVCEADDQWTSPEPFEVGETRTVEEADAYNAKIPDRNKEIGTENTTRKKLPRHATFTLVPINLSIPTKIVDAWLAEAAEMGTVRVTMELNDGVSCERRVETIGAKAHGSLLTLEGDGSLLWRNRVIVSFEWRYVSQSPKIILTAANDQRLLLSQFEIEEIVGALYETNILSTSGKNSSSRRR